MRKVALFLVVLGCVVGCSVTGRPPRADETDRIAQIVTLAIAFPRQDDAVGYARAANATRAAEGGELTVVGVSETQIVLRVHLVATHSTAVFSHDEPEVFTCYDVAVDRYGTHDPVRRTCPAGASPVHLPPPPRVMEIPDGADAVVRSALRRTSSGAVEAFVRRRLHAPRRGALAPEVRVASDGSDVGVSVRGEDACLLGSRVHGKVLVWRPSRVQVQPGELSCDPQPALGREGITPPH